MSQQNDVLMVPIPFTFEGQSLPLAVCTGDVEIAFTSWVELNAKEKLDNRRAELGNTYEILLGIWYKNVICYEFEWPGEISFRIRNSETGKKELLRLMMLKAGGPPHVQQIIDRIFRCPEKMRELFDWDPDNPKGLYWRSVAQGRPTLPESNPTPEKPTA